METKTLTEETQKTLENILDTEIHRKEVNLRQGISAALESLLPRFRPKESFKLFYINDDSFYELFPNGDIICHYVLVDHDADRSTTFGTEKVPTKDLIKLFEHKSPEDALGFYERVRDNVVANSDLIPERINALELESQKICLRSTLLIALEYLFSRYMPKKPTPLDDFATYPRENQSFYQFNPDGTIEYNYLQNPEATSSAPAVSRRKADAKEIVDVLKSGSISNLAKIYKALNYRITYEK
jgi:hypothetical protein